MQQHPASRKNILVSRTSLIVWLLMVIIAATFILGHKWQWKLVEKTQQLIINIIVPLRQTISQPFSQLYHYLYNPQKDILLLKETIQQLQEENKLLQQTSLHAMHISEENQKLQDLLSLARHYPTMQYSGRIIMGNLSPFSHAAYMTKSENDVTTINQAVINDEGFVGYITHQTKQIATVRFITDANARIPIIGIKSRYRGIAKGQNTPELLWTHLPSGASATLGEIVVTSGDGGLFPYGIPLGVVSKVLHEGASIRPFVNWNTLEFVTVLAHQPIAFPENNQ